MPHLPTMETFCQFAARHKFVPVYRRLVSDTLTPVSAFQRIDTGEAACLFESVIGGEKVGRYSFLAVSPRMTVSAVGHEVTVEQGGGPGEHRGSGERGPTRTFMSENPLDELRSLLASFDAAHLPELPPFAGGAIGYAAYDVVRYVEDLPNAPQDDRGLPDLSFGFFDSLVVFDNVRKTMTVIAFADLAASNGDTRVAYDVAASRVDLLVQQLSAPDERLYPVDLSSGNLPPVDFEKRANFTRQEFEEAVGRCVEYIRAGDIFQVVISQRWAIPIQCPPFEIYRSLRIVNPSPFMFFVRTKDCTLVGSSPEIMCRVVDGKVTVRPLAGTRPRGATEAEDNRLADELMNDPKERAEHVMLVDLGRNDVGRVAEYGSVELTDVMTIERYSHVMHITSNVTGQLAAGLDAFDALQASLPAGTVSGAPKVRAMEIIDELEPHRRGPYAGAVGYLDFAGNMDTCIALRTMVVQDGVAYVQAGAGIVADSVPANEYQETVNKARGLIAAIAETEWRAANT